MKYYTNVISYRDKIYCRYIENGKRKKVVDNYEPTLFLPSNEETEYLTIDNQFVKPIKFSSIEEGKEFINNYKEVANFKFYGNTQYQFCYISDCFSKKIEFSGDEIAVCYLDIEVGSEYGFPNVDECSEPVIAITLKYRDKFFVFGCDEFKNDREDVHYIKCKSEIDLLERFLKIWIDIEPDIVTGWNVEFFDISYLVNRMMKVLGEEKTKTLSPWQRISKRKVFTFGKENVCWDIMGITILDYLFMYKKYATASAKSRPPNFRLDTVAHLELKENKISYDEYGSFHNFYTQDFQKFIEYNIRDVELVVRIDEKKGYINQILTLAYDAKVNYRDVFAQVRMWDTIIFNYFKEHKIVLPQKNQRDKTEPYEGAYVKEVTPGLRKWVASFDLDSLYPHLIAQFNISPECLRPSFFKSITIDSLLENKYNLSDLRDNNLTIAANGHNFSRNKQGFLPEILMKMYKERKAAKNKMLKRKQELEYINQEMKNRGIEI